MPQQWTSSPISLADGLVIEVQVTSEGVTCRKSVDGVYASDLLLTPEQAERYGKALIEGATRAMRK